jgi:aromatic-amino-acid transaminase
MEQVPFFTIDNVPWGWRERATLFAADPRPEKLDLVAGVLRDESGKHHRFSVVAECETAAQPVSGRGYLPPTGYAPFCAAIEEFLFGSMRARVGARMGTVQTLGAAGALRLASGTVARLGLSSQILLGAESWGDHHRIFEQAGLTVQRFPYLNSRSGSVDEAAFSLALDNAPLKSAVLLQVSCHNPTGIDPSEELWKAILERISCRGLLPIFDLAYPGFGAGIEADLAPLRAALDRGLDFLVATSCCKLFGIPAGRVGALTVVTSNAELTERLTSQIKTEIQGSYSTPPLSCTPMIVAILTEPNLRKRWEKELEEVRQLLVRRRQALGRLLHSSSVIQTTNTTQQGMFYWTGLSREQCESLRRDHAIYLPSNGRLCIGALPSHEISRVAAAIVAVSTPE